MAGKYGYVGTPIINPITGKQALSSGKAGQGQYDASGDDIPFGVGEYMEPMEEPSLLEQLGLIPKIIDPNAPGAVLDTSGADAQRQRTQALLAQLQQQAATGDGSWQDDFASAVQRAKATASALGQSQPGMSAQSALMNIGNAQAAAQQRSVTEEEMLRNQAKLDAREQMSGLLGQQATGDITQAAEEAGVIRGRRSAQQALNDQAAENREKFRQGVLAAVPGMSDGGKVPGRAPVFGDDEANDTVRAMLSPGEIVIPRSIALGPNAPEQAADFVRAVQARKGPQGDGMHFAGGGGTGLTSIDPGSIPGELSVASILAPTFGNMAASDWVNQRTGTGFQPLSTTTGSLLNTEPYRETFGQQEQLAGLFGEQAAGAGPSMAPAMAQQATDNSIAGALQAQQRGETAAAAMQQAAAQGINTAANAGRQAGREQSAGQRQLGGLRQQMRGQEGALATAAQRAAWENTLANAGVTLDNQERLLAGLSRAGQAAGAIAANAGRGRDSRAVADEEGERGGYADISVGADNSGEWDNPYGKWEGGEVGVPEDERKRAERFLRQLSREAV